MHQELVADDGAKAALRAARVLAQRQKRVAVARMAFEGMTTRQIAAKLGISRQAVSQMSKRYGFPIGDRGATLRITGRINCHLFPKFALLAEAAGQSTGAYLARMIKVATEDPEGHRRYMGRAAQPTRAYRGNR